MAPLVTLVTSSECASECSTARYIAPRLEETHAQFALMAGPMAQRRPRREKVSYT